MAKGDMVRVSYKGMGTETMIPVYELEQNAAGVPILYNGLVVPKFVGGVKGNTVGKITEAGIAKAPRSALRSIENDRATAIGADNAELVCVWFPDYQREAWVEIDHTRVIGNLS
jgi:hypothetical protein